MAHQTNHPLREFSRFRLPVLPASKKKMFSKLKNGVTPEATLTFISAYKTYRDKEDSKIDLTKIPDSSKVLDARVFTTIFSKYDNSLEVDDNSIEYDLTLMGLTYPCQKSFMDVDSTLYLKFSVLDILSSFPVCPASSTLKVLLKSNYPKLLINTYKYTMLNEFYETMKLPQSPQDIIYKLFILTLESVVTDVECVNLSPEDMALLLEQLSSPPSLEFCKNLMCKHEISGIIEDVRNKCCLLYNYEKYYPKLFIHFEFHSRQLTILKVVNLQT